MKIKEHNVATGEVIEREMSAQELKDWEADKAAVEAEQAEIAAKAKAKQDLLSRLGISAEEAALLLA